MTKNDRLVAVTTEFVRDALKTQGGDHDWWHIYRVWQLAKRIAQDEPKADALAVELAALMHDLADPKIIQESGVTMDDIAAWLRGQGQEEPFVQRVLAGMQKTSFHSSIGKSGTLGKELPVEAKIVSDADKLDAMGAIGIARAFSYGGKKSRMLHDPDRPLQTYESAEEYHANDTPTINHFYEKLLLLKDRMHTATGKKLAEGRHQYMERFLEQFYAEWDGKR